MIETLKDARRGKDSYEDLQLQRTANQILHRMEDQRGEDNLESTRARVLSNARTVYGPARVLDTITFASTSSKRICAAIVEHSPMGRSYIHCTSAKESSRLAAYEHLLVITEDLIQRLMDAEGISSSGWLPATSQAQHAAASCAGSIIGSTTGSVIGGGSVHVPSVAGSAAPSRRGSVQPPELSHSQVHSSHQDLVHHMPTILQNPAQQSISLQQQQHRDSPQAHHMNQLELFQPPILRRHDSDQFPHQPSSAQRVLQRTNSDIIQQPKPMSVGRGRHEKVRWNLGSDS